jgi:hypothetical protein
MAGCEAIPAASILEHEAAACPARPLLALAGQPHFVLLNAGSP